jgi:hypothetical protein
MYERVPQTESCGTRFLLRNICVGTNVFSYAFNRGGVCRFVYLGDLYAAGVPARN